MHQRITFWECMGAIPNGVHILILLSLVLLHSTRSGPHISHDGDSEEDQGCVTETTRLLNPTRINISLVNGHVYGSTSGTARPTDPNPRDSWARPEVLPSRSYVEDLSGFSRFFPYMWPSEFPRLQAVAVVCFLLVILQRVLNVWIPVQIGAITTSLANQQDGNGFHPPWFEISMYVFTTQLHLRPSTGLPLRPEGSRYISFRIGD